MGWIDTLLTRLEANLRLMIEGTSARDGFPRRLHGMLERELIATMRSNVQKRPVDVNQMALSTLAPDQYTLILPAIEAQILLTHPTELDRLTKALEKVAYQAGIAFTVAPVLRVVADPHSTCMNILAEFCHPGMGDSSTYQLEGALDVSGMSSNGNLPSAYLIVNGLKTFTITQPVINIGRDPSNQLQLDDAHISSQHAQLRLVHGRFVIFDLDSHDGTFVNGVPVSSHTLNPGDVIQLAGLPLVYGQDTFGSPAQTQELPVNPLPPEVL